jgi:hypothetical protein
MSITKSAGIALALTLLAVIGGIALMGQAGTAGQQEATKTLKKKFPFRTANRNLEHRCGRIIVQHVTERPALAMGQRLTF